MEYDRRNPPNFMRMVEMGNSDGLIDIAADTKNKYEFREAALIHLIYFYGRIPDSKIEGLLNELINDKDEQLSGMAKDGLQVFNYVKGHTEDVDYIIELMKNNELGENVRIGVEMVAERHSNGPKKDELAAALRVSRLRGGYEKTDEIFELEEQLKKMNRNNKDDFRRN